MTTIQEVFKQFCKERHAEDKGKNYDTLQEVYASTEFFDVSLYDHNKDKEQTIHLDVERTSNGLKCTIKTDEGVNLPFQNNFIKQSDNVYVFMREYAPNIITGSAYAFPEGMNSPFFIDIYPDQIEITATYGSYSEMCKADKQLLKLVDEMVIGLFKELVLAIKDLNNLSHKSVAVDKPVNTFFEYYRRKRKPTIKVPQRPIYYVLGEKDKDVSAKYRYIQPTGTLEYSYAFKVRGHWRRVGDKTLGKDRNGVYGIKGYTWVTEHIRGEGELAKRLHVIK